jgi:hypothetical protein
MGRTCSTRGEKDTHTHTHTAVSAVEFLAKLGPANVSVVVASARHSHHLSRVRTGASQLIRVHLVLQFWLHYPTRPQAVGITALQVVPTPCTTAQRAGALVGSRGQSTAGVPPSSSEVVVAYRAVRCRGSLYSPETLLVLISVEG